MSEYWGGRTPKMVRMLITVRADFPFSVIHPGTIALSGYPYEVYVNPLGAVSAILPNGEKLGLKPDEFEVVEWVEVK